MRKNFGMLTAAFAVLLGLSFGSSAMAEGFSVAIVDVPQVVNASAKVQALKKEQQAKAEEIVKFIEKARKDVSSITDANKKKAAEEKYNKELLAKKEKASFLCLFSSSVRLSSFPSKSSKNLSQSTS